MDVSTWLRKLGLGEYAAAFAANHIDWATLRRLTADDLRDIGVNSVGHRRRLLEAIARLDDAGPNTQTKAPHSAERRPVTVLFADLCGFTALSRDLPDERLHALVDRYLAAADEIVTRHGGTVDKHIGDAVMALFGAPVAHDDDMLRALRAAAELRACMPKSLRRARPRTCDARRACGRGGDRRRFRRRLHRNWRNRQPRSAADRPCVSRRDPGPGTRPTGNGGLRSESANGPTDFDQRVLV